jgi:Phosphorylase superfamily
VHAPADPIQSEPITIAVATALEARAVREAFGATANVVQTGVALRSPAGEALRVTDGGPGMVLSCGLAGGTRRDVATGTVLVPSEVVGFDGARRTCDEPFTSRLIEAARKLGHEPLTGPLYTSAVIVRGSERERLAAAGYTGIDMETARMPTPRLAAIRVVLDTPERELSDAWLSPLRVLLTPSAWLELPWLMREGPRCARLAARIAAEAFAKPVH